MSLMSELQSRNNKQSAAMMARARHDEFITQYIEWLGGQRKHDRTSRQISIIARSPVSPVVTALLARCAELEKHRVAVHAIFAELGPDGALADFAEALENLRTGGPARDHVRWARNACLRDAHEQLILGSAMCWSGDCMRREPGKRDSLDLFEANAPKVVRLGTLAFDAIWAISELIPTSRLSTDAPVKPSAAYAGGPENRFSVFSRLRKLERTGTVSH